MVLLMLLLKENLFSCTRVNLKMYNHVNESSRCIYTTVTFCSLSLLFSILFVCMFVYYCFFWTGKRGSERGKDPNALLEKSKVPLSMVFFFLSKYLGML